MLNSTCPDYWVFDLKGIFNIVLVLNLPLFPSLFPQKKKKRKKKKVILVILHSGKQQWKQCYNVTEERFSTKKFIFH